MNIQAIIFDKDGTLFDFQATWGVWAGRVLENLAKGDAAKLAYLANEIGYDLGAKCVKPGSVVVAGTPREIAQTLAQATGDDINQIYDGLNIAAADAPQALVSGIIPALTTFRQMGLSLAVMTNDAETPARAHLTSADLTQYFDLIVGSDSGRGYKPAPDPLLSIARDLGVPPSQTLMVGDSLHDLRAGRAAGMRTIGVLTGLADIAELSPLADVVLPSAAYIPDWVTAQNASV